MADLAQVEILKQGRDIWNDWRARNPNVLIDLRGADLRGANLTADQSRTAGVSINLVGADLRDADLRGAHLGGPYMRRSDLALFNTGDGRGNDGLADSDLRNADLSGAYLGIANLRGADLRGVKLNGADLVGIYLGGADLRGMDLSGRDLSYVGLSGAKLTGTSLSHTKLYCVDLDNTNLTTTDLSNAELTFTRLVNTNLTGTPISSAIFNRVYLGNTIFGDLDLRTVAGLDTCRHLGPSILDHRTLIRSGQLPLVFLRGCGLPDRLIDYLPSLFETAVQFYSCFISYAAEDEVFADRLHADLQNRGVRCWFAPQSAEGGKKLYEQIDKAIRLYDKLLLILSPHSMRSEWVSTEIAKARQREVQQGRQMLFPVRLVAFEALEEWQCFDADTGKDSAREIREYFIPDFSHWKDHDAYTIAFDRLLRDLTQ
jgi:uncharacterized protein YjbI with pentapeptide repeats